ncbi:MAG TPA: hypothetical protein VFR84_03780 [Candidatus Angelobacter sp.]|nr:hypothetical protein [Candidatus Angelobacter sp.]
MKNVELAIGLTGTALQAFLCFVLLTRRLHRQFRFFMLSALVSIATTIALLILVNHPKPYFYFYWYGEAVSVLVVFFALQESFNLVFRNFLSLAWFRLLFPGVGILMVVVATSRAAFHPVAQASLLASALISLEIAVGFLQVGVFFLFLVLVRFFHMRWRQYAFGVVCGFGVAASGTLVVYLLRSEFGTKFNPVVRITAPLAYIAAVVVWLATFLRAEASQAIQNAPSALTPEQMALELRRYTSAVKGFLGR